MVRSKGRTMGGDGGHAATAAVLGNENLLHQILIHVGYPTSLLCAALVCKQWLRHVTDPDFLHGFHGRHDLGCHSRRQLRRLRQLAMEEARPQQTAGVEGWRWSGEEAALCGSFSCYCHRSCSIYY
uniref:F-box domain-containing protein n=1 Tax=Hordeum vulgare subsp. vulgare TaxID=112509 RepID=A0A8I6Y209_HORVV